MDQEIVAAAVIAEDDHVGAGAALEKVFTSPAIEEIVAGIALDTVAVVTTLLLILWTVMLLSHPDAALAAGTAFTDQGAFSISGKIVISKQGIRLVRPTAGYLFASFQLFHLFQNRVEME